MLIRLKQLEQTELALFIQQTASGGALSGNLAPYFQASGWVGNHVVYVTGNQHISGTKTFDVSPIVPYSGNTGTAPTALFVIDKVSNSINTLSGYFVDFSVTKDHNDVISGYKTFTGAVGVGAPVNMTDAANASYVSGVSGSLSSVHVTGSSNISTVNLTGLGGTLVIYSGGKVFISGAAAGGGGGGNSNVSVTGSSTITSPNFTGIGSVTLTYDGTYVKVSGAAGADATLSGFVENNFVHRGTVDEIISGVKTFTGNPQIAPPTLPSGAVNLLYLSGVSGSIVAGSTINNTYYITGTGVVTASSHASGSITNTFTVTSGTVSVVNSGTTTNTYNGTVNNTINLSGITGNFVNISFYYDQNNLSTGLNTIEAFISRSFFFTGYALGCINSGTQGFFSGSFYQRTPVNTKTNFVDFSLNSGMFFTGVGGLNQEISGMNRVGLDIYRVGTGITGLSVGLFGVGY